VVSSASTLAEVVDVHLREKMGRSDLPALLAAHANADDLDLVRAIDRALNAVKLAGEDRLASQRMGLRIATECRRLRPAPALDALCDAGRVGRTPCNAAVAQGVAGRAMGLEADEAALVACYTAAATLTSAAVRLLRLGHGEAQAVLMGAHPAMRQAVAEARELDWHDLRPCAPQLDVAAARHQRGSARLFAS
jgi:urease accessory protein